MTTIIINEKVTFQAENSTLTSLNGAKVSMLKLDHLESTVLNLLVENAGQLISYEEFLSNWRSSEATENSLSRVVSLLRKKLKQTGLTENVIINTSKKGYTFVAEIELTQEVKPQHRKATTPNTLSETHDSNLPFQPFYRQIVLTIAATLLLASLVYIWVLTETETPMVNIEETSYVELLSDTDIKIELNYNQLTDKIAYSKKAYDAKFWQIEILNRWNGESQQIKEDNKNVGKPAWLNESNLVYRLYDEANCEIKKATLDLNSEHISSIKLFPCNPNSYASALAKFGDSKLLITDAELNNTASSLFIGDLQTGQVDKVDIDHGGGAGFYNVITTPNSELVALLSSSDGTKFKIQLVDSNNEWQTIWMEELKANNFSVGWDGVSLSFRNDKGGITVVSFDGNDEVKRANIPTLSPTRNISSTSKGLIMTSGEFRSQDLSFFDSKTNEATTFTLGSSAKNRLAAFFNEQLIIYVSNKTGINQIWSYNTQTKESNKLSAFTDSKAIRALAIDAESQLIAIQVGNNIELFAITGERELSKIKTSVKGQNPEFFDHQLVFTKYDGEDSSIAAISLDSFTETPLKIAGAFFAKKSDKHLFYSKRYLPGIWQYNS